MQLFMAVGRYGPVKTSVDEKSNPSNLFKTFYFSIKSIPARCRCSMICDTVDNQYSADFAFSLSYHRFLLCHINIIIYRLKFTSQSSKKQYYFFSLFFYVLYALIWWWTSHWCLYQAADELTICSSAPYKSSWRSQK